MCSGSNDRVYGKFNNEIYGYNYFYYNASGFLKSHFTTFEVAGFTRNPGGKSKRNPKKAGRIASKLENLKGLNAA